MSDAERFGPQPDSLFEEQLKAARLTLHVDGRLVRSEPNTPAGRQAIDKAALLASETSDDVRVGPEAVDRQNPRQVEKGNPSGGVPVSAASRPTLAPCCKSETYPGPSGIRRRHSFQCPNYPGQPIGGLTATVRDISAGRLAQQHRAQTRRAGLDEAIADHPASYVGAKTHSLIHIGERAHDCIECAERAD
jgi:hypothetical protein